ncbi:unnamed protein product [Lasius platythorax]|uniref:Myb/SANT-like DNA-binding domain-containing protein n=1 Tax=Lasius platythorax TaxID=488582 RepID=A0AAV2NMT9_9HYME
MTHKKIWNYIATVLSAKSYHVTGPQCLSKYNGIKRTYKSIRDHNAKSGNNPRSWPYMDVMESLLGERPYMSPLAIASSSVTCSDSETNNLSSANNCISLNSNPRKRKIQGSETNNLSSASSHADLNSKPRKRKIEENALKISESIIESRMLAEKNREQRHKEKMEFKKDMLGFMQKLLDKL